MMGHDLSENSFSGRWLFAAAFDMILTRTGAARVILSCGKRAS